MNSRAPRPIREVATTRMPAKRTIRLVETPRGEAIRNPLEQLIASIAARWRGHEAEIAVLGTATLIIAVAAVIAGADALFTSLVTVAVAVTIWSPWRDPK
jgi:hypothetical protein